jgi:multiple sugar transport system permease protein
MDRKERTFFYYDARLAFWMMLPIVVIVLSLVIVPVLWNLWLSFKAVSLEDLRKISLFSFNPTSTNFAKVFSDPDFLPVLWTTLIYTVLGSALSVFIGLGAALLVHGDFKGRKVLRGLLISPYIAPIVAVTFTWSFILDPQLGVINWLLVDQGLIAQPIPFLSQRFLNLDLFGISIRFPLALTMVVLFEGWRYFPFAFLFILARLQAIPNELYRAASVDGAGAIQQFRHITLPQLATVLSTLFLFRFIWTLNKFDDIFLLTSGQSGTKVLTIKVYDYAFGEFDIGASSAAAMVLFGILALFLFLYFQFFKKEI